MESHEGPMEAVEVQIPAWLSKYQVMDVESGRVVMDCLGIPLILRKVLQHFSTAELLEVSLVNKLWSYEARSLLRDRGTVTTVINKKETCQDLAAFASALQRTKETTKVLPFSGLTINVGGMDMNHTDLCVLESSTPELDQAFQDILNQLTWKHMEVRFSSDFTEEFITCPGFLLLKNILERFGPHLEKITLGLPWKRGDFMQEFIEGCCDNFPRLQILRINGITIGHGYTNLIKWLVSHAPNLKVLRTCGRVNLSGNLLEGSSAVHVSDYPFSPFFEIPDDAGPFRMTRMVLVDVWYPVVVERFNRITAGLLEASRTTLTKLEVDALALAPLTTYGITLDNVTTFEISFDHQKLESMHPLVLRVVKSFDFTRTFPNLTAVKLNCSSAYHRITEGIDDMIEQGNAAFRYPTPDRAANIKTLSVEGPEIIKGSTGQFLAEMFPNIESLSVTGTEILFGRIWESLNDLKVLDVNNVNDRRVVKDLDSVLCGIFPEEVAELRGMDEEYLRSVNIVPVMPSITCLKSLTNLNLIFGKANVHPDTFDDPTSLFPKVAGSIAFQRRPHLVVTLLINEARHAQALSHLKPYATIRMRTEAEDGH